MRKTVTLDQSRGKTGLCSALIFEPAVVVIEQMLKRQNSDRTPTKIACGIVLASSAAIAATAQETNGATNGTQHLPELVVEGRAEDLTGVAVSAAQGSVGAQQLRERPILRTGEVLEAVPGVIITQHAGGGKANQYFLRGFNLDHGTDFITLIDGMPVNLPTHGHGQGYSDLNFIIPELVRRVDYQKGVYYAENGDFSSAGSARLETFRTLDHDLAVVEGGMYGYARGVFASSPKVGSGHLLYGIEAFHHDGPWKRPDAFQRFNGILAYSEGDDTLGYSITARGYHGKWNSSDQVAASAVREGIVPLFGSLNGTTGGDSQRYSLQAEWHRADASSATWLAAYGFYYDMDLFSDFTYFLTSPQGDQFEQTDKRWTGGGEARHTWFGNIGDAAMENTVGLQLRSDSIRNGLFQTVNRRRTEKLDYDGNPIPATTRSDEVWQFSISPFVENRIQWHEKFRTVAGLRADYYRFDVHSRRSENSGTADDAIVSPKLTLIAGPWKRTEFYLQGGLGFHSNDGRGTTTRVDPVTGSPTDSDGNPIRPADPLVRTYGAEIGMRTTWLPGLQSTLSFWWLDIDSELLFVGDAGATEVSRPSRRYGVEWANFYNITPGLTLDADLSWSHAEFRDDEPGIGRHIPGSIESVIAAGISYRADCGFFSSLRLRYFGPRPLTENNSVRSSETILLNAQIGYRFNDTWAFTADLFNLLDRRDQDITYFYESRVSPGQAASEQVHFHPVEPIQVRFAVTARF